MRGIMDSEKQNERILLVDDTPENIDVLNEILIDYKRSIALNGQQALKIAQSEKKPDLILLDIMMPGMDGYETCEKLKGHPLTFDIPVIFTTALGELKDKVKGFELGAVDYITKPFEPEELLKRVETHLTIARLRKDLKSWSNKLEEKVTERTNELREVNMQLSLAKEEVEKSDKLKSEFLAQMSHEIGTPLNSLLLSTEMIAQEFEGKMDDEIKVLFDSIQVTGKRIFRTVKLIMNMSQIKSGSYKLTPENINLDNVIGNVVDNYRTSAKNKNISLKYSNRINNTNTVIDRYSVIQIVDNLLDNALKYTERGEVEITLSGNNKGSLLLSVRDTGIGIGEDYQSKIFDIFSQEQYGYERSYDGNGLGLPLVKGFCELNNLELDFESIKGTGTVFRVTIPIN